MLAFNNDQDQADRLRAQVLAHEAADEIVQGIDWQNGKGCFIGCITHSDDALEAASLLGGDLMLIRIAERIFESLPNADAKTFPARVLLAPRVGADLSLVPWHFLHWLVTDALTLADEATREACQPAVEVLAAKVAGSIVTANAARAAAYAARAAADAATYAADAAADAATYAAADAAADAAYAARAAADAATYPPDPAADPATYAAADAAADAAYAARAAADAATYAADAAADAATYAAADAAADAADAAEDAATYAARAARAADAAARVRQANKIVELLAAA